MSSLRLQDGGCDVRVATAIFYLQALIQMTVDLEN